MAPTPKMPVHLRLQTYKEFASLRDALNDSFFDGKQHLGVDSVIRLLLMYYRHVDERECSCSCKPTIMDFEKWIEQLPKRGRPRLKHPKPKSRPRNPLAWDEMVDRPG